MAEEKPQPEQGAKALEASDFLGLLGFSWARFQQLDAISKAILQRVQDDRAEEFELAATLLKCQTPTEAFTLYTKWLSDRSASFVQDGAKIASLWTQLYGPPPADKTSKG